MAKCKHDNPKMTNGCPQCIAILLGMAEVATGNDQKAAGARAYCEIAAVVMKAPEERNAN